MFKLFLNYFLFTIIIYFLIVVIVSIKYYKRYNIYYSIVILSAIYEIYNKKILKQSDNIIFYKLDNIDSFNMNSIINIIQARKITNIPLDTYILILLNIGNISKKKMKYIVKTYILLYEYSRR